jgi:putative flavoprotein involved in K+ transport
MPYDGDDPDGFMSREEIVAHLSRYAARTRGEIREGVEVTSLVPADRGFRLETSDGPLDPRCVVVCTGAYQEAYRPPGAASVPPGVVTLDTRTYRNPTSIPDGVALVVGSGQSGCQIAEELVDAGRKVVLSCGRAAWVPRRIGDHDVVWWALETGFMDQTIDDLPSPAARFAANITASGVDGGHDLHPRTLRGKGVTLAGRFLGCETGRVIFDDGLAATIAWDDARYLELVEEVETLCRERGLVRPDLPVPEPFDAAAPESLDLDRVGGIVFSGGFRPAYGRWVHVPGAFDDMGFPVQHDGASTVAPGLFFVGVHFLRTRRSSLLFGVGDDATLVAGAVADLVGTIG